MKFSANKEMNRSRLRKLLILNLMVITLIGVFLSVKSSHQLDISDLPEDNFTRLLITKTLTREVCDTASSNEILIACHSEEAVLMQGYASGLVFKSLDSHSYILTAAHFCEPYNFPDYLFSEDEIKTTMEIRNIRDEKFSGEILYVDNQSDLCLVSSENLNLEDVPLAANYPVLGEKIYAIADPKTITSKNVSLHFEGAFSGCDDKDLCYFTLPATSGSSGSIILNKDTEIVGMIQMVPREFDSVSLGIGLRSIEDFLLEASESIGIDVSK